MAPPPPPFLKAYSNLKMITGGSSSLAYEQDLDDRFISYLLEIEKRAL